MLLARWSHAQIAPRLVALGVVLPVAVATSWLIGTGIAYRLHPPLR